MNGILYFFRDKITGIHYLMYAFGCYFLMFSIIGYLFKQKYSKIEIKLGTSKPQVEDSKDKEVAKSKKEKHVSPVVEPQKATENAMGLVSATQVGVSSQPTATQQPVINQPQTQVVQPNVANNSIQK